MKLTVICVFHNQKDNIEPTLTALYEADGYPFEVVIINDASNDQGRDVIQSLYDYYRHEHTFIIDHDEPHGKGNCLNEATQLATGDVIWLVDRIDKVNVDVLAREVDRLIESQAMCLLMGEERLPEDIEGWVEQVNNSRLLTNENYLWKWKSVPPKQRFFNPYQSDYHATEAAIRIAGRDGLILGEHCYEAKSTMGRLAGISSNRAEILISLFRERKLGVEQADLLLSQLKLKEKRPSIDTTTRTTEELLDGARAFLHEGYNIDALEICDKLLEKNPGNRDVLMLKVQVLNRLNRYVEAAELKHRILHQFGYDISIPKAGDRRLTDKPPAASSVDNAGSAATMPSPPTAASVEAPSARLSQLLTKPPEQEQDARSETREQEQEQRHDTPDALDASVAPDAQDVTDAQETTDAQDATDVTDQDASDFDFDSDDLDAEYDFPEPIPIRSASELGQEPEQEQQQEQRLEQNAISETQDRDSSDALEVMDDSETLDTEAPIGSRPLVSVVIPTASDRRPELQQALICLADQVDLGGVEFIVVDNASLGDTFEYLDLLESSGQFQFSVITNKENKGFAYAANQGLDAAKGAFVCVMHNDVMINDDVITLMVDLMEQHREVAILGPVISDCHNEAQLPGVVSEHGDITETDYLDSAFMMIRAETGLRFDTAFGLAWFEDKDICRQASAMGHKVAIANAAFVEHAKGTTTDDLGVEFDSKTYWNNKANFDRKWELLPIPGVFYSEDPVMELVAIGTYLNPWLPEPSLVERARQLLTSETRTQIHRATWDYDSIAGMMQLLMVVESRDLLRHLEDKLTAFELREPLCFRLVSYYYDRSIYSRCLFYLSELSDDKLTFRLHLLRLRIAVNEKKLDYAIPMIQELYGYSPTNPEIMRLLGELHKHDGNYEDAEQWYLQAKQLDPVSYAHLRV